MQAKDLRLRSVSSARSEAAGVRVFGVRVTPSTRVRSTRACGTQPQAPTVQCQAWAASPASRRQLQCRAAASAPAKADDFRAKAPQDVRVLVVGCTGYIGKFVTKELVRRGYNVVAFTREKAGIKGKLGKDDIIKELEGAEVRFGNVADKDSLRKVAFREKVDVVVSCLASRTGGKKDSWAIDYEATKNCLDVGREMGLEHFVLLSAICVQKPLLEFQRAKLKLEGELEKMAGGVTYSIVRPTAFFKSLAGQIQLVKDGQPYVMFGDGTLAACKPISERDLASFIADCVQGRDKVNQMLPIGGPGKALTARAQADMLFRITGRKDFFIQVPIELMDGIIGILDFLARFFPEQLEDAAEFGRIGRYYAAESMLVWDPVKQVYLEDATPSYGNDTLEAFFTKAVKEGLKGQELGDAAVFGINEQ